MMDRCAGAGRSGSASPPKGGGRGLDRHAEPAHHWWGAGAVSLLASRQKGYPARSPAEGLCCLKPGRNTSCCSSPEQGCLGRGGSTRGPWWGELRLACLVARHSMGAGVGPLAARDRMSSFRVGVNKYSQSIHSTRNKYNTHKLI